MSPDAFHLNIHIRSSDPRVERWVRSARYFILQSQTKSKSLYETYCLFYIHSQLNPMLLRIVSPSKSGCPTIQAKESDVPTLPQMLILSFFPSGGKDDEVESTKAKDPKGLLFF